MRIFLYEKTGCKYADSDAPEDADTEVEVWEAEEVDDYPTQDNLPPHEGQIILVNTRYGGDQFAALLLNKEA